MKVTEGDKTISIIGFRDVKIGDVDTFLKKIKASIYPATVQIVDAMKIAGMQHLFFAFLNAKKSFEQGRAISENLEMETLLYASGKRQINKAIEMLGIKSKTSNIAAVLFASKENELEDYESRLTKLVSGVQDDSVLDIKERGKIEALMEIFEVTDLEVKAVTRLGITTNEVLTWLIVERVSLLTTDC